MLAGSTGLAVFKLIINPMAWQAGVNHRQVTKSFKATPYMGIRL